MDDDSDSESEGNSDDDGVTKDDGDRISKNADDGQKRKTLNSSDDVYPNANSSNVKRVGITGARKDNKGPHETGMRKRRYCHYWNNNSRQCPYQGKCRFLHEDSPNCKQGADCSYSKCQFSHQHNSSFLGLNEDTNHERINHDPYVTGWWNQDTNQMEWQQSKMTQPQIYTTGMQWQKGNQEYMPNQGHTRQYLGMEVPYNM